jgi:hypothetical protein
VLHAGRVERARCCHREDDPVFPWRAQHVPVQRASHLHIAARACVSTPLGKTAESQREETPGKSSDPAALARRELGHLERLWGSPRRASAKRRPEKQRPSCAGATRVEHHEYEAIAAAGATVQLDCPDLAMGRHSAYAKLDMPAFRKPRASDGRRQRLQHSRRQAGIDPDVVWAKLEARAEQSSRARGCAETRARND